MTRKEINKELNKKINDFFLGYTNKDVDVQDIDEFMDSINEYLQTIAHEKIPSKSSLIPHVDRRILKDSLRLFVLKSLAIRYHSQVVEYLWEIRKRYLEKESDSPASAVKEVASVKK